MDLGPTPSRAHGRMNSRQRIMTGATLTVDMTAYAGSGDTLAGGIGADVMTGGSGIDVI